MKDNGNWKRLEKSVEAYPHAVVVITKRDDCFHSNVAIIGAGLVQLHMVESSYIEFALEKMSGADIEFLDRKEVPIARGMIRRLLPQAEPYRLSNFDYVAEITDVTWYESERERLARAAEIRRMTGYSKPELAFEAGHEPPKKRSRTSVKTGATLGALLALIVVAFSRIFFLHTPPATVDEFEPVTISGGGEIEHPIDARGLDGRVAGDDGVDVRFLSAGVMYTLRHLTPERFHRLVSSNGHLLHIARSPEGLLSVSDLGSVP